LPGVIGARVDGVNPTSAAKNYINGWFQPLRTILSVKIANNGHQSGLFWGVQMCNVHKPTPIAAKKS